MFCREYYPKRWRRRFAEDLVGVMATMGTPIPQQVALELEGEGEETIVLRDVEVSEANRELVLTQRQQRDRP